ncbi:hypothetical protein LAUMK42_05534 [Mycobacterium persicum]|uniref:Uncharacterized protein n=1 Tax=Mycobacterium persicum TaxID=1487726 RepID=A0AB38V1L3_9MYCO|nr:hypothetical protein LAUMK42_05534 [Mycobacterium persicum]
MQGRCCGACSCRTWPGSANCVAGGSAVGGDGWGWTCASGVAAAVAAGALIAVAAVETAPVLTGAAMVAIPELSRAASEDSQPPPVPAPAPPPPLPPKAGRGPAPGGSGTGGAMPASAPAAGGACHGGAAAEAAACGDMCRISGLAPVKASSSDDAEGAGGDGGTVGFGVWVVVMAATAWMWPRTAPSPPSSPAERATSVAVCTSWPVKRVTWTRRSAEMAWAVGCRAYQPIEPGAYIASVAVQPSATANPDWLACSTAAKMECFCWCSTAAPSSAVVAAVSSSSACCSAVVAWRAIAAFIASSP